MAEPDRLVRYMDHLVYWVEVVAAAVLALLAAAGVIGLVVNAVKAAMSLDFDSLPSLFSSILLVFILLELYAIGTGFLEKRDVTDKVFEVGLVALVRQVIVAEFLHLSNQHLLTIAALVVALGIAWFLSRRAQAQPDGPPQV